LAIRNDEVVVLEAFERPCLNRCDTVTCGPAAHTLLTTKNRIDGGQQLASRIRLYNVASRA
jgi:hypothetical protein